MCERVEGLASRNHRGKVPAITILAIIFRSPTIITKITGHSKLSGVSDVPQSIEVWDSKASWIQLLPG